MRKYLMIIALLYPAVGMTQTEPCFPDSGRQCFPDFLSPTPITEPQKSAIITLYHDKYFCRAAEVQGAATALNYVPSIPVISNAIAMGCANINANFGNCALQLVRALSQAGVGALRIPDTPELRAEFYALEFTTPEFVAQLVANLEADIEAVRQGQVKAPNPTPPPNPT